MLHNFLVPFASYLYNLCDKKGFEEKIENFKNQSVNSFYFEFYIANAILKNYNVELIVPCGEKRKDYGRR